jgi:hypothetical protein
VSPGSEQLAGGLLREVVKAVEGKRGWRGPVVSGLFNAHSGHRG